MAHLRAVYTADASGIFEFRRIEIFKNSKIQRVESTGFQPRDRGFNTGFSAVNQTRSRAGACSPVEPAITQRLFLIAQFRSLPAATP
jgi:hypothetical protein